MQNGNLPTAPEPGPSPSRSQGPSPSASDEASLDFASLFAALLRGKWIILATALVVAGTVGGYTYTLPNVYRATSMVRIDAQGGSSTQLASAKPTPDLTSEVGVLRSSFELARRVAQKLRATEEADGSSQTFPVLVNAQTGEALTEHEAAREILNMTSFSPRADRGMIEISVESEVPEQASTVANIYAREYKTFALEKARASISAARKFLEEQAEKQREKINRLESQWESFAKKNQVVVQGEGGERVATQYSQLESRRDELAFQLENEEMQLELLRRQLRQFEPQLAESMMEEQEESSLRSEISALEGRIANMRAEAAQYYVVNPKLEGDTTRIRNEFPELASTIQQMNALEARKQELTQELIAKVSSGDLSAGSDGAPMERISQLRRRITEKELTTNQLQSQIAALDSQLATYESRLDDIPQQRIERQQLERKLNQAESFYGAITGELQKVTVAEESELGYVEVVRSAFVPSTPVRPNTRQNIILGVLLGIGFGMGLAFLREATDSRLRRPEDIEKKGYNLLGVVPVMDQELKRAFGGREYVEVGERQISTRLMPLLNPWSSITENYRLIQTNMKFAEGEGSNAVLVTSARQGEGKTTTAVNLALTAALSGRRVLLIDADMRRPTAHKVLGVSRSPGLADMLGNTPGASNRKASDLQEAISTGDGAPGNSCVHRTLVDNLFFIPAGVAEKAPAETLDSGPLRHLVDSARKHFDMVVIDTPPTRAASDAVVLGAQTKASALVVSAEESDHRALDSVMKSLRNVDINVAGVVFNRFDEKKGGSPYYDYSYYGSEDYYDSSLPVGAN